MKKIFNKAIYMLPLALLYGCEPEFDDVEFNGGSADFSKTVAVGNSLFAGFQSNALSADGQTNSLPNMVATQLKSVGGGDFSQPLIPGNAGAKGVGIVAALAPLGKVVPEFSLTNVTNCANQTSLAPALLPAGSTMGIPNAAYDAPEFFTPVAGPFNNVSVPGAKVGDLTLPGYGSAQGNPYFARFASNPLETMVQAAGTDHTFFMMWIGNNDVLGYATSGGDESGSSITPQGSFETAYNTALDALERNGAAEGVIANIPYVTSIPYFYAVPPGTDALTDDQVDQLMNGVMGMPGYGNGYNAAIQGARLAGLIDSVEAAARTINFSKGSFNYFVVEDTSLTPLAGLPAPLPPALPSIRQLKPGELMTLTTPGDSLLCARWGTAKPIPGVFYLSNAEIAKLKVATDGYNAFIRNQASTRGLAFYDANSRLVELASTGITINGIEFTNEFVSGGAFSLDGVHPSTRGYAILANDFIQAINTAYGASVPKLDVGSYPVIEVK